MDENVKTIVIAVCSVIGLLAFLYVWTRLTERVRRWNHHRYDRDTDDGPATKPGTQQRVTQAVPQEKRPTPNREVFPELGPIPRVEVQHLAFEMAGRANVAFETEGLVETYYYARLARRYGHRQIVSLLGQVRNTWLRMGCPPEHEMCHDEFTPLESAIGRALLRIETGVESERGYACLVDLANDGNFLARALLEDMPENPYPVDPLKPEDVLPQ